MGKTLSSYTRPTITFTSDFGWASTGVGIMKAVAAGLCPSATIIDLTHGIEPFSTLDGACALETLISTPPGGIHVCVVDPGVGSNRRIIAIKTKRSDILVGPDNGVLLPAARRLGGMEQIVSVSNLEYLLNKSGNTFDGRDVMAPAAAALGNGISIRDLGEPLSLKELYPTAYAEASWTDNSCAATIIHVNRYGSVYLNIENSEFKLRQFARDRVLHLVLPNSSDKEIRVAKTFSDVPRGSPLIFEGHFERVQAAVNWGSFVEMFDLKLGSTIQIKG